MSGPALDRTLTRALRQMTQADPHGAAQSLALVPAGEARTLLAADIARALAS